MSEADNSKNRNGIVKEASFSEQPKTGSALGDEALRAFLTPKECVDSPNTWKKLQFAGSMILALNYLQPEIERIGRKYHHSKDWVRFISRVMRLAKTYDRLTVAKALPERSGMPYPTYQDLVSKLVRREARKAHAVRGEGEPKLDGDGEPKLSKSQIRAISDGLSVMPKLVQAFLRDTDAVITPLERKSIVRMLSAFGALPPGPPPGPDTQETWRIYRDLKRQGNHGSPAAVARLQYSAYVHADPSTKRDYRDRVKAAIRIMPQQS